MHSHSGQFCPGHAQDKLEEVIRHAVGLGYETIGLTEHMPRYEEQDLYPEEVSIRFSSPPLPYFHLETECFNTCLTFVLTGGLLTSHSQLDDPKASLEVLPTRHEDYLVEAQRLQREYASQIHILIGFEAEFIRPSFTEPVRRLASAPCVDYFIGSVHHVHSIPIDYDAGLYASAVAISGGSEEKLFEDYYDLQHQMLLALEPRIVGHFDLIRLMSSEPGRDVRQWKGVWERITRNLRVVKEQGGWLECNSSALRKGLDEPYPCRFIAEVKGIAPSAPFPLLPLIQTRKS